MFRDTRPSRPPFKPSLDPNGRHPLEMLVSRTVLTDLAMLDLRPALTNLSAKAVALFMIMELEHSSVVRHPPPPFKSFFSRVSRPYRVLENAA